MNINYNKKNYTAEAATICPWCHSSSEPRTLWQDFDSDSDNKIHYFLALRCQFSTCTRVYFADFTLNHEDHTTTRKLLGGHPVGPIWVQPIIDLESKFQEIYLQSLEAEHLGLDEIAGMGYRKSLEFLVKDWAKQSISKDDLERENKIKTIQSSFLGTVINDFYSGDLQQILKRAVWLGNDEAHFIRLFNDMPVAILKELIALVMVELDRQYKMNHYIETITPKK